MRDDAYPPRFASRPMPQAVDIPVAGSLALLIMGSMAGLAMALGLAWFMSFLISSSDLTLSESDTARMLDFVRVKREEKVERKERKPERPKPKDTPEVPPMPQESQSADTSAALSVSAPTASGADLGLDQGGLGIGSGEGDYLPIVKVAPQYPRRALARGLTGTCTVKYTVTTSGTVKNVEVVAEMCAEEIFARPSIEAARRFRYKPRVIDGTAVEVEDVYNKFHFEGKQAFEEEQ